MRRLLALPFKVPALALFVVARCVEQPGTLKEIMRTAAALWRVWRTMRRNKKLFTKP